MPLWMSRSIEWMSEGLQHGETSINSFTIATDNVWLISALWLGLWAIRHDDDPTKSSDLWTFLILQLCIRHGASVANCIKWFTGSQMLYLSTLVLAVAIGSTTVVAFHQSRRKQLGEWQVISAEQTLIHRCRTTHTRLFPEKHTFSYSYLQVSIPVISAKCNGRILSIGGDRYSLFRVDPTQYLERDCPEVSLEGRLSSYLTSQGVARDDWSHAYLVTAPQFLGYSFNPVSFWYIYNRQDELSKMVLEVNNTFDERRMYLLSRNSDDGSKSAILRQFSQTWPKDFHVSPFNSREGSYTLQATSPFESGQFRLPGIDNTIRLISSQGHPKLTAKLHSDYAPVACGDVSIAQCLMILSKWAWLGFFTSPRILKEAFVLFFRRKLHVWLRPEVQPSSIGRNASAVERTIEGYFRRYLAYLLTTSGESFQLRYRNGNDPAILFASENGERKSEMQPDIEIKILSPEFFTRLVHYDSVADAFWQEGPGAAEKCNTVSVKPYDRVQQLLQAGSLLPDIRDHLSTTQLIQWKAMSLIKRPPSTKAYEKHMGKKIISSPEPLSTLDQFAALQDTDSWRYRRAVTQLFLADWLFLGIVELLDLCDLLVRIMLMYASYNDARQQYFVHAWAMLKG